MNVNEQHTFIFKKAILFCFLAVLSIGSAHAQCVDEALTCNDNVNVFLAYPACEDTVVPDDILEGGFTGGCYTVSLFLQDGTPLSPADVVDATHIGLTLNVVITNIDTGTESCTSSTIGVFDAVDPVLTDCGDVTVDCGDSTDPSVIGEPTVMDCDPDQLTFSDGPQMAGDCADPFLYTFDRTWTATDGSGNTATCTQTITVNRLTFDPNNDFPANVTIECDESSDPANTGYPQVGGMDITSNVNPICGFTASYTDTPTTGSCTGQSLIQREWMVFDDCGNMFVMSPKQLINIVDNTAPVLSSTPADITLSTGGNSCLATGTLPTVTATDNCSTPTLMTVVPGGTVSGNTVSGLAPGSYVATVTATDACGNDASLSYNITVADMEPPVPICETTHTVAMTSVNPTLVPAIVFDDGSYDWCGPVSFRVSRLDGSQCPGNDGTAYGAFAPFYCCDLGETIQVSLEIMDAAGNLNFCTVNVIVQDAINPVISCPADIVLDCDEDYTDLLITGSATATDNCATITPTFSDAGSLNSCGVGTIIRTWIADDGNGNIVSCPQTIQVLNSTPFYINPNDDNDPNDDVIWPADVSSSGCALPASTGEPIILNEDICSQANFLAPVDLTIDIANGCQRIYRTWTAFDNCQPSVNGGCGNPTLDAAGIACWTYVQTIDVINTTAPVITNCPASASFCSDDLNCSTGVATLTVEAQDDCNVLVYSYEIDLDFQNNPGIDIPLTLDAGNDGILVSSFALGTHQITWKVEDQCGNVSTCTYPFTISDCLEPTPSIIFSIARNLMSNTCMVEVDPTDWDNPNSPSFDNCGPIAQWLIISPAQSNNGSTPPAGATPTWTFSGVGSVGTQTVDLWLQDINGNWAVINAQVLIQNNSVPPCASPPDYAIVSGGITNEEAEEVEHVMVGISGGMEEEEETGNAGTYSFDLPMENNYTVTPARDDNPLNGVSTYDLVKISQHILENELLTSPYKIIAADINHSGHVSAIDLVELRKLILFIDTEFSNNTSWRFIDAEFVFPDPTDPFATTFPEVYTINDLNEDMQANFVGVKIGDVNCSAAPNDFSGSTDDRNAGTDLIFNVENQKLEVGKTYTIDFELDPFSQLQGYQFTLAFDQHALAFESLNPGTLQGMTESNFGFSLLDQGIITTSWNSTTMLSAQKATGFSITFKALKAGNISDLISINSNYTKAQAYLNNQSSDVKLGFESEHGMVVTAFQLFQNRPNPFKKETVISFHLPEDNAGVLTFYDFSGRVIKEVRQSFNSGYNEVSISSAALAGSGVYYYRLNVADQSATRKMVLLQ